MTSKSVMKRVASQVYGKLKDHTSVCTECSGTGIWEEDSDGKGYDNPEPCWECDGDGEFRWPSWYTADFSTCDQCGEEGVPIQHDEYGAFYCLKCLVKAHKEQCGCNLWRAAEKELGL